MESFNETTLNAWLTTITQPNKKQLLEQLKNNWKSCLQANFSFDEGDHEFINSIPSVESAKVTSAMSNAIHAISEGKRVILHVVFTKTSTEENPHGTQAFKTPTVSVVQNPISKDGNHPEIFPILPIIIFIGISYAASQGCVTYGTF